MKPGWGLFLPLAALLATPASADDRGDVTAAVAALYAGYSGGGTLFDLAAIPLSSETRALAEKWAAGIDQDDDEVEDLEDFDWLCECQEWDPDGFSYATTFDSGPTSRLANVSVTLDLGWDSEPRELLLTMVKEGNHWKLDDQYSLTFPTGLKGALKAAIAAHENARDRPASEFDRAVLRVFGTYMPGVAEFSGEEADWDLPVWSAGMTDRIAYWKEGLDPDGLIDDLEDFGWLCECQDWDPASFKVTLAPHGEPTGDRAEIDVSVDLGWDEQRAMHLTMVREGGQWLVDELVSESFPDGLSAAMLDAKANREAWSGEPGEDGPEEY